MPKYNIQGNNILLTATPADNIYTVTVAKCEWVMSEVPYIKFKDGTVESLNSPVADGELKTGTHCGFYAEYELTNRHGIRVRTSAEMEFLTDDIYFTVQVDGDENCEIDYVKFPAPFNFGEKFGDSGENYKNNLPRCYAVMPRMQGAIIPVGVKAMPLPTDTPTQAQIFSRDAYMPIFAQIRENTGYLAIYDTPYDAKYEVDYEDGRNHISPVWMTSMGKMSYRRKMIYRFMENCDHNDIAKSYRQYVKDRGNLITLEEKIAKNPNVKKLLGCPIIHEGIAVHISPNSDLYDPEKPEINDNYVTFEYRAEQIKALRAKGLKKAYTHFDGWGYHGYDNLHPDPFPPHEAAGGAAGMKKLCDTVRECGYLFGIHDQYRDYYYDSPDFSFDNAVMLPDGTHPFCSIWYGGPHTFLCPTLSRDYVRKNYTRFKELGINLDAAYLDVFSIVELDECVNPAHPVTRESCAIYRCQCLEYLTSQGIIPSSEEVIDCVLPSQVLCHHAPFLTSWIGDEQADPVGINIPLLNLVYHDCIIVPWKNVKGSRGGWGLTKDMCAYTYAFLCGNPVYIPIDADEQTVKDTEAACAHAERLALKQMMRHEFISADHRVQRTVFGDGVTEETVVEVDLDSDNIIVK